MLDEDLSSRLRQLQWDADAVSRRLERAAAASAGSFSGSDSTSSVEVSLDGDGRVERFELQPQWRQTVGDQGLGGAVIAALTAAGTARMTTWAQAINLEPAEPEPVELPRLPQIEPDTSGAGVRALLATVNDAIAALPGALQRAETAATQHQQARNWQNTVTVTTRGGIVESIAFDPGWLSRAEPTQIAKALTDALNAAPRDAEATRAGVGDDPALDRLRQLTASPETLLRAAGFIR